MEGILDSWKDIIDFNEYHAILNGLNNVLIKKEDILKCFKFREVKDIHTVIIGLGPNSQEDNGLAFGSNSSKCPTSLSNILKCTGRPKEKQYYNLHEIAAQGVLLLNIGLTNQMHLEQWYDFILNILQKFISINNNAFFFLFGVKAQELISSLESNCIGFERRCYARPHPAPQVEAKISDPTKKFINDNIIKDYEKINWDYSDIYINCYTDGSCSANGKKTGNGYSGYYIPKINELYKEKMLSNEYDLNLNPIENTNIPVTNNRTELLAIGRLLQKLSLYKFNCKKIRIYSDSEYCIKMLTKWFPSFLSFHERKEGGYKNLDLIKGIYNYYIFLKPKFIHVRGHTKNGSIHEERNNIIDNYIKS